MSEKIFSIIERETDQKCTTETTLEELGVDSLELLDLLMAIEQETGLSVPDSRLAELHTVGDIIGIAASG
jgi:acyl carrier protein